MNPNLLLLLCSVLSTCFGLSNALAESVDFSQINPIFQDRCVMCHSGSNAPLSLRLDSLDSLLQGSSHGPVVIAGRPAESELILRLKGTRQPRMPMTGPPYLSEQEVALIEQWILGGMVAASKDNKPIQETSADLKKDATENDFVRVLSIFGTRCVKCHAEKGMMGPAPEGYLLTSYENILSSRDRVRVVPNYPEASELVRRIKGHSKPRMPFDGPPFLTVGEIDQIVRWIKDGARNAQDDPAEYPLGARVRLHGRLVGEWQLEDGLNLQVFSSTRIDKSPRLGDYVEVRGQVGENGAVYVERIRRR